MDQKYSLEEVEEELALLVDNKELDVEERKVRIEALRVIADILLRQHGH